MVDLMKTISIGMTIEPSLIGKRLGGIQRIGNWCLWIDSVLEPFVSEVAWFRSLRLELWS